MAAGAAGVVVVVVVSAALTIPAKERATMAATIEERILFVVFLLGQLLDAGAPSYLAFFPNMTNQVDDFSCSPHEVLPFFHVQ